MRRFLATIFALSVVALLAGAADGPADSASDAKPNQTDALLLERIPDEPSLHNLLKINSSLYSGGEPHGEESFERLAKMGVSTVVSVDGARPDVEGAKKHGLRYIHIPIGYDGISETESAAFYRVAKEIEGPIYVHCHHGKHRGPAAAAVICRADGVDAASAAEILAKAGTSKDYKGLWRDVAAFEEPAPDAQLPPLVEAAEVASLAAAMADIDHAWDNLKLAQAAGWKTPEDHPDIVPQHQALIVREGFHEALRMLSSEYDDAFRADMQKAEDIALAIEDALTAGQFEKATTHLKALEKSCTACHTQHRN